MKFRLVSAALLAVLLAVFVAAPLTTKAQNHGTGLASFQGIQGTVTDLTATYDRATDTINVSGLFTDTAGNETLFDTALVGGTATAACDILNLVLGPLDLNILGLEVHLNQVILDIVAQPGPGNLLGNLLCAVAGLLDGGNINPGLANLLNRIFGLLS